MHFSGRSRIDAAFAAAGIEPSIVLEAIDADVIKTYVATGMGVGIVAGVHTKSTVNKKGPDEPGLKTKSTQDFSDPEKDGAPEADRKKYQPVRP